jgi:hypothetical protein
MLETQGGEISHLQAAHAPSYVKLLEIFTNKMQTPDVRKRTPAASVLIRTVSFDGQFYFSSHDRFLDHPAVLT